jgi:hypothetical protein
MAIYSTRHYFSRRNPTSAAKAALSLLALTALGYIVIAVAQHALPLVNEASRYALESRMINPDPETGDAQATAGAVSAAEPATNRLKPDVDYFPNGYVNQATRIEEPIATF